MFATPAKRAVFAPQSTLEQQLIIDYLAKKGYRLEDLKTMPVVRVKELMTAACTNASLKLTEIEARSQFRCKIKFEC